MCRAGGLEISAQDPSVLILLLNYISFIVKVKCEIINTKESTAVMGILKLVTKLELDALTDDK